MYEKIPEEDGVLTRHQDSRDSFSPAVELVVAAGIPSVGTIISLPP